MKTQSYVLFALLFVLMWAQTLVAETEIKLNGRKDLVLSVASRATVLDAARQYVSDVNEDFLALAAEAKSPYVFEQPAAPILSEAEVVEKVVVNYDDISVLGAVIKNFEKQVRGTLARGDTSYLQLKGGHMIKPGTSFPVSIPEAEGQTFTVTISEINADGYTLKLGQATRTVNLSASGAGSGAVLSE
jgi:hypothetical protein